MKTEPAVPLHQIRQCLHQQYNMYVERLEFLPIGEGAWCFRGTGERDLFIRLVKEPPAEESLRMLQVLHEHGLPAICALPNISGNIISLVESGIIVVYPFIHGTTLMKRSFPPPDLSRFRKNVGMIIARLHQLSPVDVVRPHLLTENFSKFQTESIAILQATQSYHNDPLWKEFSDFLNRWRTELEHLIRKTQKQAERLRSQQFDYVLCHADIHEDNVLVTDDGELFIIDWDEMILAPRERDVMFFFGSGLDDYLEGYRRNVPGYHINQTLIDYYVCEWALQEIVDYGTRILDDARFDTSGRLDAWQQFQRLFEPEGDVEIAFRIIEQTP